MLKKAQEYGVDWILSVVALIDTYLSVYYTWAWHVYTGERFLEALTFSLVVVLFAVIVFEFGVRQAIRLKEERSGKGLVFFLFGMWTLVVAYSIQTTIAGQYINVMKAQVSALERESERKTAQVQIPLLEGEISLLESELSGYEARKAQLERILEGVDSVEKAFEWKRTTAQAQAQWESLQSLMKGSRERLLSLKEELRIAKAQAAIEELKGAGTDVFAFYARVLGVKDTSKVHFVLAVFKGVILDLINVICFGLVQLRSSWRKEEHERIKEETEEIRRDPTKRASSAVELLANESFGPGSERNPHFCGRAKATRDLKINPEDYDRIVSIGIQRGVLKRRGRKIYKSSWATREDFLAEVK